MNAERHKRHSCESCRSRKLKCSGEKTGCSRCTALSLRCKFRAKGAPGRPRKRITAILPSPQPEIGDWELQNGQTRPLYQSLAHEQEHQQKEVRHQQQQRSCESSIAQARFDPCGLLELSSSLPDGFAASCDIGHLLAEIDPSALYNNLPEYGDFLEHFGRPASNAATHNNITPQSVSDALGPPTASPCECGADVLETLRLLKQLPPSHALLQRLRIGVDLFERLLTCPVCYNLAKPPRITIQNVLLIGRLMVEVTSGYQHYLQWIRETCTQSNSEEKTVHVASGEETESMLAFAVSNVQFREMVIHGLCTDAQRISALGKKFERRQHDRHKIGHEKCPTAEERCWKEENTLELDPLDICPHNPAAKVLTPCFRIVEEVQSRIQRLQYDLR
ncbi:C6 finger domain protein, putative [Beauveria bassiana ARSEF 2860]|uniref:C6 finger domain protein, putative n=1 Tax=Beauveria bassiana (strain ARSEF 2860) TaxID=655819 RepID=J4KNS0_BEAB2|nr:C6 finger domain protein, putative [Beauveria bassiana ARSEF 2860]EJP66189.1 C6 finger domain protein, putative [Beauveria bassiana ARSEF 2860]